jgi:hypothetical protein
MAMDEAQEVWVAVRQALLMVVDAIERHVLHLPPEQRTATLRKAQRQG